LEDVDVEGKTILKWILGVGCEELECVALVQDRDRWRSLVNVAMDCRIGTDGGHW